MDADLTRERGLWGPPNSSQLDKWALDMVEGISKPPQNVNYKDTRKQIIVQNIIF